MSIFSKDFHPAFSRIAEIRAIVPFGTLLMDCTATETRSIQEESVSMSEVVTVKLSPNRSNIMCVERRRTDLETDFSESLSTLKEKQKDTLRVVVYCRTLIICADLFSCFSYEMGKVSTTLLVHLNGVKIVSLACFMLVLLNTAKM